MTLDPQTLARIQFLHDNYIPVTTLHLKDEEKIYLGEKDNRQCRFCGKSNPDTSFKQEAHAIPEFTGNKKLFAYYECDLCNAKFSRLLESHMANYMNLWHTFSQVKGKRGVPSFKTIGDKSRIDIETDYVKVQDHDGDNIVTIDELNKTITFKAKRRSYVPVAIYKCLAKMALTVMPEEELGNFKDTLTWINEDDHDKTSFKFGNLVSFMSIAPGAIPYPFVTCMLFKRKETPKENAVPYMLFILAYGNFAFQIHLPLCSKDEYLKNSEMKLSFIPTAVDFMEGSDIIARKQLKLDSTLSVKGEEETVVMQFENITKKDV